MTLCGFDYCLANKISKCGENILKAPNLKVEISSMKLGSVSLSSLVRFDNLVSESLGLTLLKDQIGVCVKELFVKHKVLFKCSIL